MIVQIYETQSLSEAKQLVTAGVDHVGVLVGKGEHPREFSAEQAREILQGVTGQAKKIVLSLSKNLEDIAEIVYKTNPDILHLGTTPESLSPEDVRNLKQKFLNLKIMRSIPVRGEEGVGLAKQYDNIADYLLLDTQKSGDSQVGATGETHDWSVSRKIVESVHIPVILAGGLGPDNVAEAISRVKPFGVDSKTKTDKADSHEKDITKVRQFTEAAKSTKPTPPSSSEISPKPKHSSRVMKSVVLAAVLLSAVAVAVFGLRKAQESFFEEVLVEASFEPMPSVGGKVLKKIPTGSIAPDFILEDDVGKQVTLRDLRGKSVVLLFFARWNDASLEAIRTLQNSEAKLTQNGITTLAIGSLESKDALQSLKERGGFALPLYADPDGIAGEAYTITTLPSFFFIDAGGILKEYIVGSLRIDEILVKALP